LMEPRRIAPDEVKHRVDRGERLVLLDMRADESWRKSDLQIPGSRRVPPDDIGAYLGETPKDALIVTYCTSPHESSSARAARTLLENGWRDVRPLLGGFNTWRAAGYAVEPKLPVPPP
jgi:rhodanese-related sulfurtransferase